MNEHKAPKWRPWMLSQTNIHQAHVTHVNDTPVKTLASSPEQTKTDTWVPVLMPDSSMPNKTSPPQSHLGTACRYASRQRMHSSAACASCTMSTADKSSYLAVGTLHPYYIPNRNLYVNAKDNPIYCTATTTGY